MRKKPSIGPMPVTDPVNAPASVDWSHETVLAAEPVSVMLARDFVCRHLRAHQLSYLVEDVRLVLSELATNAVVHAQTPFTVSLSSANGSVLVAIRDGSALTPVRSASDAMAVGGRGLFLVDLLSHTWGADTEGDGFKTVWATFRAETS